MDAPPRSRSFSIIANLTELESFILHDSTTQALYQQYLAVTFPASRKSNHVRFYADVVSLASNHSQQAEYFRAEMYMVYERYFTEQSELRLEIPREKMAQVRHNVAQNLSLMAFKPAIKAVVKDLVFIHLDSFLSSEIFKEYKDSQLAGFNLSDVAEGSVQEKESTFKLRKFFGEKDVQGTSGKVSLGDQPKHIKEYKLSKIFGERVGVEKTALLDRAQEPGTDSSKRRKRDRRLHVFFGNNFAVEETLYSERVRSHSFSSFSELCEFRKQPTHVNSFRLAKFFGVRPPGADGKLQSKSTVGNGDVKVARHHSQTQHLIRFFGERIDPVKEATHASFASQPENVKGVTLKKIFGESAAHTIQFDSGTWPRSNRNVKSRAKLEKIFGPFEA